MSDFKFESDKKYIQIVSLGVKFNTPEERYRMGATIVCDRCQTTPIREGYGLGNQDLCMPCVRKIRVACYLPDLDDPYMVTMMCQEQFSNPNERMTFMRQNQFSEGPLSSMLQRQYNTVEPDDISDSEYTFGPNGYTLFDEPIQPVSQETKPAIKPESMPVWRTKMVSEQYMQDCLTGNRRGRNNGAEICRRLEEMQRLRDQPIPSASNIDDLVGYNIIGTSALDSQFSQDIPVQTSDRSPFVEDNIPGNKPNVSYNNNPPASSYPKTGMILTRMAMGMFQ